MFSSYTAPMMLHRIRKNQDGEMFQYRNCKKKQEAQPVFTLNVFFKDFLNINLYKTKFP